MKCLITTVTMKNMLEWLALVSNFDLNHHCPKIHTTLVHNTYLTHTCVHRQQLVVNVLSLAKNQKVEIIDTMIKFIQL